MEFYIIDRGLSSPSLLLLTKIKILRPFRVLASADIPAIVLNDDELTSRVVMRGIIFMSTLPSKNPKIAFTGYFPFEKLWDKFFQVRL
ncbi:hypothetical protein KSP40_PGU002809 [Platanthera guangdongensis]|uniref:Uncharacterized protein n=1 Tax=Platanthera guangdongensis TaxID=2320717 RepID=A0ABR2LWC3_9ASPA